MGKFQTEGIVLKQFDLGEADKIITFYTRDKGKIRAVARGARKTKSKLSGLVLPFSYNQITIYRGRSLDRINHIDNLYSFSSLREDLLLMAYASYIAELVVKVGKEDNPNQDLFSLLLTTYHRLHKSQDNKNLDDINLLFKFYLLQVLGFNPEINKCVKCERKIKPSQNNNFNIRHGGLVCKACLEEEKKFNNENIISINGEALAVWRKIMYKKGSIPHNLRISDNAFKSLNKIIDLFISYHLDIKINSEKFLHMIKNFG
ncbi:MAG: DNA repair protein RecO [Halanaerobiales bacterium]